MHQSYRDIISRIAEEPIWFDEHAVPRYCEFAPDKLANIHAGEGALAEVTCQVCKRVFRVAFSEVNWESGTIADAIRSRTLHYGDPPDACCGNADMNSEPRRVVEYWHRHDSKYVRREGNTSRIIDHAWFEWVRDPGLEVDIRPSWVDGDPICPKQM